ncbi:MAG: RNA methyltransferase [Bacteroidota bacterium]
MRLKKYRLQSNAFAIEGAKNIKLLLESDYKVQMVVGTADFLASYSTLLAQRTVETFQVGQHLLASLGVFQRNNTALAIAHTKANKPITVTDKEYGLVLDDIRDPGNLGTITRIADWYGITTIICSPSTVELYNPKVLHASMGSFTRVKVYYVDLPSYLSKAQVPIVGTFTSGAPIHHTALPAGGLVVIGNETRGISEELMPYIQQQISIPRYGYAESLNAAIATAVVCDNLRRKYPI